MAVPVVKRASLNDILAAARTWLAAYLDFPADRIRVFVAAGQDRPPVNNSAERDILVEAGGLVADTANRGRHDCRVLRELIVTVRTRANRDKPGAADYWMTDPERGSVTWEEAVVDALQGQWLEDDDRNALFFEPPYLLHSSPRRRDDDGGWGEVRVVFGLPVVLPLTQR